MMQQILLGQGAAAGLNVDDVFDIVDYTGNGSTSRTLTTALDLSSGNNWFYGKRYSSGFINWAGFDTVRGAGKNASLNNSNQEENATQGVKAFNNGSVTLGNEERVNHSGFEHIAYLFKGAEQFFDVVTYSGNGTAGRTISHGLNAEPGMIIIKALNQNRAVRVYHTAAGNTKAMTISHNYVADTNSAYWNNTSPTSSVFTVGNDNDVNANGTNYVAYLFAKETDNVIKCGGYTGSSASISSPHVINLGYQAQWVMVKAIDRAEDWFVFDAERGDNHIRPNQSNPQSGSTAVSLVSNGFALTNNSGAFNSSSHTYLYVAIAAGS